MEPKALTTELRTPTAEQFARNMGPKAPAAEKIGALVELRVRDPELFAPELEHKAPAAKPQAATPRFVPMGRLIATLAA